MKSCITCGMPLVGNHAKDLATELPEGPVCKFDFENGQLKSGEEIFKGGVEFFSSATTNGDRELSTRLTRRNMKSLSYWQARPFDELTGPEATSKEFQDAMAKL